MNVYESVNGHSDRRVVFVNAADDGQIVHSVVSNNSVVADRPGHTFIVDDYVAEQITKFKLINGQLELIDGEALDVPEKSELQLEEEQLMQRLAEIQQAKESDIK